VEERVSLMGERAKKAKGVGRKLFFVFESAFGLNDSPSTSSSTTQLLTTGSTGTPAL